MKKSIELDFLTEFSYFNALKMGEVILICENSQVLELTLADLKKVVYRLYVKGHLDLVREKKVYQIQDFRWLRRIPSRSFLVALYLRITRSLTFYTFFTMKSLQRGKL